MDSLSPISLEAVVLECSDVKALADFYCRLLGWQISDVEADEWIDISAPRGGVRIAFQKNERYVPPVWPDEPGAQQQMVHLDFTVENRRQMAQAAAHAISCGARKAPIQYDEDKWITLIDPSGHPFCFVVRQKNTY